ncbi:MAG: nuclear transport factor 2 family protein [Pseudomonadota bacterium]
MSQTRDNRALVRHFYEALGAADTEAVGACFSDDVVFNLVGDTPVSGRWEGRAECWDIVAARVFGALDPASLAFSREWTIVCADDERVVAMMRGGGTGVNGVRYDQTYCHIFAIRAGQIVELHEFFDTALAEAALFDNPLSRPSGRGGREFRIG